MGGPLEPEEPPRQSLVRRLRAVNFARLNHIFIPSKKRDRDRLRKGVAWRLLSPLFIFVGAFSREGRSFFVICLLVAAASIDIGESQVYLLFAALAGILVSSLSIRYLFRLPSCRIEVSTPSRVAVGEPLTFAVDISNEGANDVWSLRVERPFLPWDGKWLDAQPAIRRVAKGERESVRARATFVERGEHHLDAFEAARLVPLGFAVGPRISSSGARFVVVPRIANVARVTVAHRSPIRDGRSVSHSTPGDGEIAGVRPYRMGDPLKHLHVRTWARTGVPHVRHYVDERADRVALVLALDATRAPERRVEAAISLAAGIAARLANGDGTGLDQLVLGERSARVQPRNGRGAVDLVLDALAKMRIDDRKANTLAHLEPILPSLSTIVLVTSDHEPRRNKLREAIEASGVPCRWIEVVDDGEAGEAPRVVETGRIERLEAVAC